MRLPPGHWSPCGGQFFLSLTRRAESQEAGKIPGILVEGCRAEMWKDLP